MYYAQYNQMTDFVTEYVFSGVCLFAKANTANARAELLKLRPLLREQQLIHI